MRRIGATGAAALLLGAQAPVSAPTPPPFAAGQVWHYHTRPQDAGSLLKIQAIDAVNGQPVYHLSVIGVHFRGLETTGLLAHLPLSQAALALSVTTPGPRTAVFPNAAFRQGHADWQRARGGVFTVPLDDVVEQVDVGTRGR